MKKINSLETTSISSLYYKEKTFHIYVQYAYIGHTKDVHFFFQLYFTSIVSCVYAYKICSMCHLQLFLCSQVKNELHQNRSDFPLQYRLADYCRYSIAFNIDGDRKTKKKKQSGGASERRTESTHTHTHHHHRYQQKRNWILH